MEENLEPEFCPEAVLQYYRLYKSNKTRAEKKEWIVKAKKHLLAENWVFMYPPPDRKKRGIIYLSPLDHRFPTLHAACKFCIEQSGYSKNYLRKSKNVSGIDGDQNVEEQELLAANANRKRKHAKKPKVNGEMPMQVLRSSKRIQKVSFTGDSKPLTILSWLIGKNLVLPRSKVYYLKASGAVIPKKEGRVVHDGIKCKCCKIKCERCKCCKTTYSLGGFEYHATGSVTCRPSASIVLEDGTSLLDCQMKIMEDHKRRESQISEKPLPHNDYICSVCHYGGDLILCDQCPSSFHKECLDLQDIPDGDWFCPSCRCRICGQNKIGGDEHFLTCVQCEHKYHMKCAKNGFEDRHSRNWLCGRECGKIYVDLHRLIGEPVSVGDNLTWTLVKLINCDSSYFGESQRKLMAESYTKLNLALSVMQECFQPLKDPSTGRCFMEDVLFSRGSNLNRLNFRGVYTVIVEKNEEVVSVAVVRVFGKKVAEVPLVGTRSHYRRQGMCGVLMKELEKMLKQLGVERLVLPAVPSVVATWTGSFGFVKMTSKERAQFLDSTFLDFEDTIMCQKLLRKIPSS